MKDPLIATNPGPIEGAEGFGDYWKLRRGRKCSHNATTSECTNRAIFG